MSLSAMIEIPRPFYPSAKLRTGKAQDTLQAKRKTVMPAKASIQCGGGGAKTQNLPACAGMTDLGVDF